MNKKLILPLIVIFFTNILFAQAPNIQWQRSYGGSKKDIALCTKQTSDNGYILAGYSESNDGNLTLNHGNYDFWILKLDSNGNIEWQKSLGGSSYDIAQSIEQTFDGGYIVAGTSSSNDGDVTGNHGSEDYWVVKLDKDGNIEWQKSLGGSNIDSAFALSKTSDGGYIVAGESYSNNATGKSDFWIVKLNHIGDVQWQKYLGGSSFETANSIKETFDKGYIVAGYSASNDGDVTGNHGSYDYWVVKLNNNGMIEWQKSLGGTGIDLANSVLQTSDEGYIVAGSSTSNNGDVTENRGSDDYWVVKLDKNGMIQWQKSLGGSDADFTNTIYQTATGDYIIAGVTLSNDGDINSYYGGNDIWVVKLDQNGSIKWQKSLGGSQDDLAFSIQQTSDDGYILAGNSNSSDGNITSNQGNDDFWIVKLYSENLNIKETALKNTVLVENPVKDQLNIQSKERITSLQLYSTDGKLIKTSKSKNMSVKELSKGNYMLKIQLENGKVISEKIIKE